MAAQRGRLPVNLRLGGCAALRWRQLVLYLFLLYRLFRPRSLLCSPAALFSSADASTLLSAWRIAGMCHSPLFDVTALCVHSCASPVSSACWHSSLRFLLPSLLYALLRALPSFFSANLRAVPSILFCLLTACWLQNARAGAYLKDVLRHRHLPFWLCGFPAVLLPPGTSGSFAAFLPRLPAPSTPLLLLHYFSPAGCCPSYSKALRFLPSPASLLCTPRDACVLLRTALPLYFTCPVFALSTLSAFTFALPSAALRCWLARGPAPCASCCAAAVLRCAVGAVLRHASTALFPAPGALPASAARETCSRAWDAAFAAWRAVWAGIACPACVFALPPFLSISMGACELHCLNIQGACVAGTRLLRGLRISLSSLWRVGRWRDNERVLIYLLTTRTALYLTS